MRKRLDAEASVVRKLLSTAVHEKSERENHRPTPVSFIKKIIE